MSPPRARWRLGGEKPPPKAIDDALAAFDEAQRGAQFLPQLFDSLDDDGTSGEARDPALRTIIFGSTEIAVVLGLVRLPGIRRLSGEVVGVRYPFEAFLRQPGQKLLALDLGVDGRFQSTAAPKGPCSVLLRAAVHRGQWTAVTDWVQL